MKENRNHNLVFRRDQLKDQITYAQIRLYDKLVNLDINSLNISEYNQRYLGSEFTNLKGVLQLYGRLIYLCLKNSQISLQNFVLVDYGGGSGLISYLAAEMGIGTVIYNDIYDVSCTDAGRLSNTLGLTLDHIICGDVDELVSYLLRNSISINAITSYNLLEHIYDVESHFKKLGCLSDSKIRIVYASGSNIANHRTVRLLKKMQIEDEYKNKEKKWGHKERDSSQAFLDIRKNMISAYAPELSFDLVDQLARNTRGLIQRDIEKCVDEFRLLGSISYQIDHPTNTCDPYTGNWSDHLIDFKWLEQILKNEGLSVEIITGRDSLYGSLLQKTIKVLFNAMLQLLGRRGMFISPYYVVNADFT